MGDRAELGRGRLCVRIEAGRTDLFSRHANNLSASFPDVRAACLEALGNRRVVLDGEIVVLDRAARRSFGLLQRRLRFTRPPKSLLVGGFDGAGELVYCGRITSGLTERTRRTLYADLASKRRARSPFRIGPEIPACDGVRWVEPLIVARIEYREK